MTLKLKRVLAPLYVIACATCRVGKATRAHRCVVMQSRGTPGLKPAGAKGCPPYNHDATSHGELTQKRLKRLVAALFVFAFTINANAADDIAPPAAPSSAPIAAAPSLPPGTHATASIVPTPLTEAETAAIVPQLVNNDDLWERIRRGFVMHELNMPLVQNHEQFYAQKQDYIKRFVARGSRYLYHIVEELERRNLPTEIALLPIIESAFNPQAASTAKASGMWQFIPSTGSSYGLKQDWHADHRRDVMLSTKAALDYLQRLHGMFNSWELAFAAYNCGEGCVGRAIKANQARGLPTDFASLNLPIETRNYVPKLIAVKNIVLSPASYGVELTSVNNKPYFSKVPAPAKIDVKLAAKLAEMPVDEFSALNPAFNRPVASSGTGYFLVPTENADLFSTNLRLYQSLNGPMVSWQTVTARKGDSVDVVARRYGMTGSYLRATGGPFAERKGKFLKPATFMVPMAGQVKAMTAMLDKKIGLKNAQNAEPLPASIPASAEARIEAVRKPEIYRVAAGDTLHSISTRTGATVQAIRDLNRLKSNNLKVGQQLTLHAAPEPEAVAITNEPKANTAPRKVAVAPKRMIKPALYTVRSGDTLFAIATKFNVPVDNLLRWNRLKTKSVLAVGYRLKVSA
jgi:membrane-bound lytic murein transglycosylase D